MLLDSIVELNRNELSYPPPENVIEAARKGLMRANRYSKVVEIDELKERLSLYCNVEKESIFLGSGVEVLIAQILHLFSRGGKVIILDPTFFIITHVAESLETKLLKVKLSGPSFSLPLTPLIHEVKDASLVVIDNPN
jgi:histidinol-phosphate/aromatic aminotransferase/cobyric acid decarboxylase-like protein